MKLTVLSENAVLYPGLEGEFGLSVYLEEGDTRLLFDAGERDACLRMSLRKRASAIPSLRR